MIEIVPSILTNDAQEAKEMLERCEGIVERVSIDIIDGKFVDNKTIDPSIFFDLDTSLKIDYQLMVVEPINWVERCIRGQADRIIGHIEAMSNQVEFIAKVQEVSLSVGLALDIETPIAELDPIVITDLDIVLLMSVKAGFGGLDFDKRVLSKIKELDKARANDATPFNIHIDGGITLENINEIRKANADEVSIGKRLFSGNIQENLEKFRKESGV